VRMGGGWNWLRIVTSGGSCNNGVEICVVLPEG
jgi:hypothetical protein